jgi:tRNA nucleotidyltransferase (CCA-adding enzyme)
MRHEADLDIFLRVPTSVTRAELETKCMKAARRAVADYPIIERFAEHPYVETHVQGVRVNIVPCYNVKRGEWLSATDRTPFHTEYVVSHMRTGQKNEVRLLKAFLKGIEVYGADVKVSGFSGMLCETLIMYYDSFIKTLEEAGQWKTPVVLDLENYYSGREKEPLDLFDDALIVIDPVDRGRNLAASISSRRFWEFVAAGRAFSARPAERFFATRKTTPLKTTTFLRKLQRRGWNLVALEFGRVNAVVDVLWSQLYRTEKALRNLLKQEGFSISRSASWSDEKELNLILFELESITLPPVRKHIGPHVARSQASELFLAKHSKNAETVSGPWIDGDRWAVDQLRESTSAPDLLRSKLRHGGRDLGVASRIAPVLRREHRILAGGDFVKFYGKHPEAAKFITAFLSGRPAWLE